MKRKILSFIFIVLAALFLISCSARVPHDKGDSMGETSENSEHSIIISDSNRKIIYTANINIKTNNLSDTVKEIKNLLKEDDWIQSENLTNNTSYITFRIKTTRLNDFITSLQSDYETTSFKLESQDISIEYFDTSSKILTLEKEQTRLMEMYANASIEEMIFINRRLSEIETELLKLNRELAGFDSLVDFSTVYLYIYGPKASPKPPSYKKTLSDSFYNGWNAVLLILKTVLKVIVTMIPIIGVIVLPATGIIFCIYFIRNRRKTPKE